MVKQRRVFTAERQMAERVSRLRGQDAAVKAVASAREDEDAELSREEMAFAESLAAEGVTTQTAEGNRPGTGLRLAFLAEMQELRDFLDVRLSKIEAKTASLETSAEKHDHHPEVQVLQEELRELSRFIGDAKVEIAALKHPKATDDRLIAATDELDAIVQATESATHTILETSEEIDNIVSSIRDNPERDFVLNKADEISDLVIKIFEACNFQDITGQRINKVVNTLQYVEERVMSMIMIFGGAQEFENLPLPAGAQASHGSEEEADLLNGPQMEEAAISQDDIDALFD